MADEEVKAEVVEEVKPEVATEPAQVEVQATVEETPVEEVKAETPEPEQPKVEEPKADWKDKELKKKHAQIMEARRVLAEKDAEIEALRALAERTTAQPEIEQPGPRAPADFVPRSQVQAEAQRLREQEKYNEDCQKAGQSGEQRYGTDWKASLENLELLGGFTDDNGATMRGILASDDPAKVLYEIGKNPDHYHRIMSLPVERRIIEIGKIAMTTTQAKPVSNAPAPVAPVGGRAAPAAKTINDNQTDDEWYAIRLAEKRKRWERNNGVRVR